MHFYYGLGIRREKKKKKNLKTGIWTLAQGTTIRMCSRGEKVSNGETDSKDTEQALE